MSSISGYAPIPLNAVYAGTKAFNHGLSRAIAVENEEDTLFAAVASSSSSLFTHRKTPRVDFVTVHPGYVATEMTHTDKPTRLRVRWPGGAEKTYPLPEGARSVEAAPDGSLRMLP